MFVKKCIFVTFLLFNCVSCAYFKSRVYIGKESNGPETGGYQDVSILISPDLKASDCPRILEDIKSAFTEASMSLYKALDQQLYFGSIDILVPQNWTASDCQTPIILHRASGLQSADIYIGHDHPTYKRSPWTQQTLGCGQPGDFIYLPASFIWSTHYQGRSTTEPGLSQNTSNSETSYSKCGDEIRDRWLQYRFGVFSADLDRVPDAGTQQDSLCIGRSPREMIRAHADMKLGSKITHRDEQGPPPPRFFVSQVEPPRYVIILENSVGMNGDNQWDLIRTATKKFILHDLPSEAQLGLVLFNDGAHIAHTVGTLTDSNSKRNGISVQIDNKFNLSPKLDSCVRCGVLKAIEALQTSGSTVGATFILISQGKSTSLSSNSEKDLLTLARQHRLKIFSIAIPTTPYLDLSISLERLSHNTGGLSFYVTETSKINTYVGLLDAYREIQRRTQIAGPYLIHEKRIESFGPSEEIGSFVIDKYIGHKTAFNCFAMNPGNSDNGYIKSIMLEDRKGNKLKNIYDSMANYHILSLYNVQFEAENNVGMNWTYTLERLAAPLDLRGANHHVVQVTSRPRHPDDFINVHFFTNLNTYSTEASIRRPIKLFVEVKLNEVPVLDARVKVQLQAINLSGQKTDAIWMELFDNGNGDPDLTSSDGIYSRYLTDFSLGEGRYMATVFVDDNQGRAFSFQKERSYGGRTCCKNSDLDEYGAVINQKLGIFKRILNGDTFRINSIHDTNILPPSRILDLVVNVHRDTHELEFIWTAPGDDFDKGKVSTYQLYSSTSHTIFYSSPNSTNLIDRIAATKIAGRRESHRIKVVDFNKNMFYAISAEDSDGNVAMVSNICGAFMPSPEIESKATKLNEIAALGDKDAFSNEVVITNQKKPDKIVVFLALGVLSFLVVCIFSVILIVLVNRRKKPVDDFANGEGSVYSDEQRMYSVTGYNPGGSTSIYDEQELVKDLEKRHFLTSSDLTNSSGNYIDRNLINGSMSNTYNSSWMKTLSPDPQRQLQPIYQTQLPQIPQPLYAVPVPKSQRSRLTDVYTSSPRTPNSSINSGNSQRQREEQQQQNNQEPVYSNQDLQNLVDTLTEEFANENVMAYLEGTANYVDQYYSSLYNTEERLSQTSSNTSNELHTPHNKDGTIKSILKKRDQCSNEFLGPRSGTNSSHASQEIVASTSNHNNSNTNFDENNPRGVEERLWAGLSPTRVILETSYESRQDLRPQVIQELTEEEVDEEKLAEDTLDLPPPPTSSELAGNLEITPMSPTKTLDRKVRTVTQV